MSRFRTPLAWRNLVHDPRRLATAVGGIGFAVVLMFMQTGFRNALFDSTVEIVRQLDADVVLVHQSQYSLLAAHTFDRSRLYQARGCPGVAAAYPLYVEIYQGVWKLPGRTCYPIRVIAWDLEDPVFLSADVKDRLDRLGGPQTALFDLAGKLKRYGVPSAEAELAALRGAELSGRPIRLVGAFRMGTDFFNDGNLVMSAANFARYFPGRGGGDPLGQIDLGLVRVAEGARPAEVCAALRDALPREILVATRQEFIDREIGFWARSTPIGFIFFLGAALGFVVGTIICYQILHADIADHLAELATLKAMGYGNGYFVRLVLAESFLLCVLSFLPGLVLSLLLYRLLAWWTGLLMMLNASRAALVFALTLAMCVGSGAAAMRKVFEADPAELF
jgi:putative ABC transport system permease protein